MAGAGTSMLGSLVVFTVILSLQEIYRGKLASSELFTILGGFTSSLIFLFSLTFIGNFQESSGIKSGWGAGFKQMKRACSSLEARAPTIVFWDWNKCPVPHGVDPRLVVPCIKRFLKNLGYSGRLIITAVGILTNVPEDVLRTVSSTGIFLHHGVHRDHDMDVLLYDVTVDVQLPANVMVISTPSSYSKTLTILDRWGYNVICPLSNDFPQEPSSSNSLLSKFLMAEEDTCSEIGESGNNVSNSLWSKFLMADSEEDTCSDTGESGNNVICPLSCVPREPSSLYSFWFSFLMADTGSPPEEEDKRTKKKGDWVCLLCRNLDGLGAESLITHLSSREHAYELLRILPTPCGLKDGLDSMFETPRYYYPDNACTMDPSILIKKEGELKEAVDLKEKEMKKEPEQKELVDLKKKEEKKKKKSFSAGVLFKKNLCS